MRALALSVLIVLCGCTNSDVMNQAMRECAAFCSDIASIEQHTFFPQGFSAHANLEAASCSCVIDPRKD